MNANLVSFNQVSQKYGQLEVLKDVSWFIQPGEILGLFGHNGAGKTTSVKLILGLIKPSLGEISVLGANPQTANIRNKIGFLPENISFYPQLTGLETLTYFAKLKKAKTSQVKSLLEEVGLAAAANQRVKTYSKGMRQRLGLAQALLGKPSLLILDEPTVGLDPVATKNLYQLLGKLKSEGTGIIICSHVLPGVEPYIDRAIIMAKGKLEALGNLDELRQQAKLAVSFKVKLTNNQPLSHPSILTSKTLSTSWQEFTLEPRHKMEFLTYLNSQPLQDIEINPPSLEDLYSYYTEKAGALGAAGVQK